MTQYNTEFFLNRLETSLHNIELNVTNLQSDVKGIQINMTDLKQLGTLLQRMSVVETNAIEANLELAKLKEQFVSFKDTIEKHKLSLPDLIKGVGAIIGWIAGGISVFIVIK